MNKIRHIIALLLCIIGSTATAQSISEAWKNAPKQVVPTIEPNRRMDMVDLYNAGQKATAPTLLDGTAEITAMGKSYINVKLSDCNTLQIKQVADKDKTLYIVIRTVYAPAAASRIEIYDNTWQRYDESLYIELPTTADFILSAVTPEQRIDVLQSILLPTIAYEMNEANDHITATPSYEQTLDPDTYRRLSPLLHKQLTLQRDDKKWRLQADEK